MLLTRHPDGRLLISVRVDSGLAWLDSEEETPLGAARMFHFYVTGESPPEPELTFRPWMDVFASRLVLTYDDVIPLNRDFLLFVRREQRARQKELRARARADAERLARIPPRRRRARAP